MSKLIVDLTAEGVQEGLVVLNLLAGNLKMEVPAAPEPPQVEPKLYPVPAETPPTSEPEAPPTPVVKAPPEAPKENPGVITDTAGVVHDPQIHSVPPKINKDGTWKKSRRRKPAAAAPVTPTPAPVTTELPASPEPTAAPVAPAPPADPTFDDLMGLMGKLITGKSLTPTEIDQVCAQAGIPNIASIENDPAKITMVYGMIKRDYGK